VDQAYPEEHEDDHIGRGGEEVGDRSRHGVETGDVSGQIDEGEGHQSGDDEMHRYIGAGLDPMPEGLEGYQSGDGESAQKRQIHPPRKGEGLAAVAEPGTHHDQAGGGGGGDHNQAAPGESLSPQVGPGQAGEDEIGAAHQDESGEADDAGKHRHRPQDAVAERQEGREGEADQSEGGECRSEGEEDGSDQYVGHGGTVRLRPVAADEFSDVRGGLGHLVPRSSRCRRREHNAYLASPGFELEAVSLARAGRFCPRLRGVVELARRTTRSCRECQEFVGMYRLGELTEQQRNRYGWSMMAFGVVALVVGVIVVHYAAADPDAGMGWIPRGWFVKSIGYLFGLAASQLLIVGAALAFVLGRPMTWAVATFAAFLVWVEFVMLFGIVPSEWLNLSQTDLDWSTQRIAFTIPPGSCSATRSISVGR
jgi:hypothetical protein